MDDPNLFSTDFSTASFDSCGLAVRQAVAELASYMGVRIDVIREYADYYVVGVSMAVSLPSRGTRDDVDIHESEPLLVFFHKKEFPGRAPQIRSDRRDFPVSVLPHLNPVPPGEPYALCLHRGNIDDWFAEHSLPELIERARKWLEDAAMGHLIKERDRFEGTRIDGQHWIGGVSIYSSQLLREFIEAAWKRGPRAGAGYVGSYGSVTNIWPEYIRLQTDFAAATLEEVLARFKAEQQAQAAARLRLQLPGVILWPAKDAIDSEYFGDLPATINGLYGFADHLGVDLKQPISALLQLETNGERGFFPIFLCVRRPLTLIHSDSNVEILSFLYSRGHGGRVYVLPPREPLTPSFSQDLSRVQGVDARQILLAGCGALGSKIALHLARAGITNIALVDNDWLSPHNLVRHALSAESVGKNKAAELERVIRDIYSDGGQPIGAKAITTNLFSMLNGDRTELRSTRLMIDATASVAVLDRLVDNRGNGGIPVIRCELAHEGKLGFMLIEGPGRSPNLGELRASLYDRALDDSRIERWLTSLLADDDDELGAGLEDITIGLGCSSPTMKVADDIVSYHAAVQAAAIRGVLADAPRSGGFRISYVDTGDSLAFTSNFLPVEKFRTPLSNQTHGWTIRIGRGLNDSLLERAKAAAPNETGGILIGYLDGKRKTIYITRQIDAPAGSVGWPYAFRMGVGDVPEQIRSIMQRTGGLIGYVGEWHSHPTGSHRPSSTDQTAMRQLSVNLSRLHRPTFILIVTAKDCYPYIVPPRAIQQPIRKRVKT